MLNLKKPKRGKLNYVVVNPWCVKINGVFIFCVHETQRTQAGTIRIYKDGTRRFTSNSMH